MPLALLQTASSTSHPLAGTLAEWVWLLPILPLIGFVANAALSLVPVYHAGPLDPSHDLAAGHTDLAHEEQYDRDTVSFHKRYNTISSILGPLVVALSFALAVGIFLAMTAAGDRLAAAGPFVRNFGAWMPAGDLKIEWGFQVDQLSMLMTLIITGVGTLIHIFSIGYMRTDPGYSRYFAYLNLFVAFMLILVLGASYPVIFVGWEGVGLCSYLLIGFWFSEEQNANAGKKAFIVNRVGDFGFLVAMFLMWANLGALDFAGVNAALGGLVPGGAVITAICLFLFLGCAGKSAQMPLYIWLPDAMAGPTPVSALIHAATMVTGGVYLIARSGLLFAMAPAASLLVCVIGAITAFFAATIGLTQWDIKKVLAYSTVSQLGYMFVAAGVGAYSAAVFHLATHAFFKALLFLGAGSVIYALHEAYHHTHRDDDAQDMRNMGGLRQSMPITFVLMWAATLAISGIPLFSGFFSKDMILASVFERAHGGPIAELHVLGIPGSAILYAIYVLGLVTAVITGIYMTRMMLFTFHGPNRTGEQEREHIHEAPWLMTGPLLVLGVLTVFGGWLDIPHLLHFLGPVGLLDRWLDPIVGTASRQLAGGEGAEAALPSTTEWMLIGVAVAGSVFGVLYAVARLKPAALLPKREAELLPEGAILDTVEHAYYVDAGVRRLIIDPIVGVSRKLLWRGLDVGLIDGVFVNGSAALMRGFAWAGSRLQTGNVSNYAWVVALGAIVLVGFVAFR
jgi:NADH-quinone oxidoreductase subunit L